MRFMILAAALMSSSGSSFAQPAHPASNPNKFAGARLDCVANRIHNVQAANAPRFNRLGELPPGDLVLAVVREVEGCQQPVIVRQGIGAMAGPERGRR